MEKKKAPKKTTKKPVKKAAKGVGQDPQEKNLPKGGTHIDQTRKVLSFTYVTPRGKRGSYAQLVDAKISKEEMAERRIFFAAGGAVMSGLLVSGLIFFGVVRL